MSGAVVGFQLSATDPEELGRFYTDVLAWDVRIATLSSQPDGIGGAFRLVATGGAAGSIACEAMQRGAALIVEIDDLDGTLERARELGASTVWRAPMSIAEPGEPARIFDIAEVIDPQGNRVQIRRPVRG
jgi:predicted enzyme related to lactoylglutathione lyase